MKFSAQNIVDAFKQLFVKCRRVMEKNLKKAKKRHLGYVRAGAWGEGAASPWDTVAGMTHSGSLWCQENLSQMISEYSVSSSHHCFLSGQNSLILSWFRRDQCLIKKSAEEVTSCMDVKVPDLLQQCFAHLL